MSYNYTGMDIFDRGFEPMCYCANSDGIGSFKKDVINVYNHTGNINAVSA